MTHVCIGDMIFINEYKLMTLSTFKKTKLFARTNMESRSRLYEYNAHGTTRRSSIMSNQRHTFPEKAGSEKSKPNLEQAQSRRVVFAYTFELNLNGRILDS